MNWDKISESRAVNALTRIGIIVCVYCLLWQIYGLGNEIELARGQEIFAVFADYYEYRPEGEWREYDAEESAKRLEEWSETANTQMIQLDLVSFYENDLAKVVTYANPTAYEANWEDISLPLEAGRWFEGDADEVICMDNDAYKLGDRITMLDSKGNEFRATVVGIAKYSYLPNDNGTEYDLMHSVSRNITAKNMLLLNPQSIHNEKVEMVNRGAVLVKTDSPILLSKMSEHGICVKMQDVLRENRPGLGGVICIMIACVVGVGWLGAFGHLCFGYAGIDWCVILAGCIAYRMKYESYWDALGELAVTVVVCVVIILIYAGSVQLVVRKKDKAKDYTVTIIETETIDY